MLSLAFRKMSKILDYNMQETSLVAQRTVYEGIQSEGDVL